MMIFRKQLVDYIIDNVGFSRIETENNIYKIIGNKQNHIICETTEMLNGNLICFLWNNVVQLCIAQRNFDIYEESDACNLLIEKISNKLCIQNEGNYDNSNNYLIDANASLCAIYDFIDEMRSQEETESTWLERIIHKN